MNMRIHDPGQYPTPLSLQNSLRCRSALAFQHSGNTAIFHDYLSFERLSIRLDHIAPYNKVCVYHHFFYSLKNVAA